MSERQRSIVSVSIAIDGGFTFGAERTLPIEEFSVIPGIRNFDVMPDGQRFLMIFRAAQTASGEPARPRITIVVQNWHEELKRLVPVD